MALVNYNVCTQHVQENASISSRTHFATLGDWEVDVSELVFYVFTEHLRYNAINLK